MKAILFSLLFAMCMPVLATVSTDNLCSGVTTISTTTGRSEDTPATFFAIVAGTGAVSAIIGVQGSMDNTNFDSVNIVTLSPSGTTTGIDSATSTASRYKYYRCNVTDVTGTGATVTVTVGVQP